MLGGAIKRKAEKEVEPSPSKKSKIADEDHDDKTCEWKTRFETACKGISIIRDLISNNHIYLGEYKDRFDGICINCWVDTNDSYCSCCHHCGADNLDECQCKERCEVCKGYEQCKDNCVRFQQKTMDEYKQNWASANAPYGYILELGEVEAKKEELTSWAVQTSLKEHKKPLYEEQVYDDLHRIIDFHRKELSITRKHHDEWFHDHFYQRTQFKDMIQNMVSKQMLKIQVANAMPISIPEIQAYSGKCIYDQLDSESYHAHRNDWGNNDDDKAPWGYFLAIGEKMVENKETNNNDDHKWAIYQMVCKDRELYWTGSQPRTEWQYYSQLVEYLKQTNKPIIDIKTFRNFVKQATDSGVIRRIPLRDPPSDVLQRYKIE